MLDLITNKYPNTNYSGIMLDYYIKKLNEVIAEVNKINEEVDKIPGYVKNAEIVDNSYLKVKFGNGNVITYALPSGVNFVLHLFDSSNGTSMDELGVGESEYYDAPSEEIAHYGEALASGLPVRMIYKSEESDLLPKYIVTLDYARNDIHFWTNEQTVDLTFVSKLFNIGTITVDDVPKIVVRRIS